MNITKHEGKYYQEVARVAKVGELVKIVAITQRHTPQICVGDIHLVTGIPAGCGDIETDRDNVFSLQDREYVVLEPLTVMTDEPHPEIAEGSTFVVVDDKNLWSEMSKGDIITLTENDNSKAPYFSNNKRIVVWNCLSPLNIIYKDKAEPKNCDTCAYEENLMCNWPCACCSNFANYKPKEAKQDGYVKSFSVKGETEIKPKGYGRCSECGHLGDIHADQFCKECKHLTSTKDNWTPIPPVTPTKRTYTAEQIQEAKDIVYRIIANTTPEKAYAFDRRSNRTICRLLSNEGNKKWVEIGCNRAKCPPSDAWQSDVGKCVAICKLTGEPMPKWVRGK
jgi:hypothetical protein